MMRQRRQWLMHFPFAHVNNNEKIDPRYPGPNGEPDGGDFIMDDGVTFNETWADMEKVYEAGKVKAIGVSNFSVQKCVHALLSARASVKYWC